MEEITKRYISGKRKFNTEGGRTLQEGMISKRINIVVNLNKHVS